MLFFLCSVASKLIDLIAKTIYILDHSFGSDAPKIWNELPDKAMQHIFPPSEKSSKPSCLQKPIHHSPPHQPCVFFDMT